jgi:glycosyltransferase involved in cell wall biosynthesis
MRWVRHDDPEPIFLGDHLAKFAHIVPLQFGPDGIHGGAERYAYEMALAMSERFSTKLITFGKKPRAYSDRKLSIEVIEPLAYPQQSHLVTKTNPLSIFPLISHLRGMDAVFCHQQKVLVSTIAATWCRTRGIPVFAIPLGGSGWDISSYISTDRLFTGIFHISEYSRRLQGHESLSTAHVVYGGVSHSKWYPGENCEKDGSILFVGRFLPHKGIDTLLRALPEDVPCKIVGTPKGDQYYSELRRLADGKRVEFKLLIDDDELRRLYQKACCVVLPSVYTDMYGEYRPWTELLGQTIIEGMACGTPAIASSIAAFSEIIEHGRNGFLFPEGDVEVLRRLLLTLHSDTQLSQRMGERGIATVREKFSWGIVIDRCLRILDARRGFKVSS